MATELSEAVLSATGAAALIQKEIDPVIQELQRRYSPLVRVLPSRRINTTVYNFDQRSNLPTGGFVTDGGARPISTSTYNQYPFTIKNLQVVGGVTGYAEAVTSSFGSLRGREIEGAGQGLYWDIENGIQWGNAAATAAGPYPQFDGLDTLINSFGAGGNTTNFANYTFDLGVLDELIESVEGNLAAFPLADYFFLTSTTVESRVAQVLTNQQRFIAETGNGSSALGRGAVGRMEVKPGLNVSSYRDIPIIKSSFLNARANVMGTVTFTTGSTGGSLPASTAYNYMVSAVIARFGEILASPEVAATIGASGTATNTITLAFTPPSVTMLEQNLSPTLYKVWRTAAGGGTGTETLLGVVDSTVGLAADNVTPILATTIVDTGTALVPQNGSTVPSTLPTAYYNGNANFTPPRTGQQNIYLLPRDPDFILRPYVREMQTVNVYPTTASPDSLPYARVSDTCLAIRAPEFIARGTNLLVALAN